MDGHVRCMVGIAVWGRMCGNREFGGEPGSLLLYIIPPLFDCKVCEQLTYFLCLFLDELKTASS